MAISIIYTSFLISFVNVGVIGVLQIMMHFINFDDQGEDPRPWRSELIFTAYFTIISLAILWLSTKMPNAFTGMVLVNCQFLLLNNYTDLLQTRLNVGLSAVISIVLFATVLGITGWPLYLFAGGYLLFLLVKFQWFYPFDEHPYFVLTGRYIAGIAFWIAMQQVLHLSQSILEQRLFGFLIAATLCYGYLLVLRHDHVESTRNAHDVHFDSLTSANNWLTFREDLDAFFLNHKGLAIVAMDIDRFKEINDTYGHLMGNQALVRFVATMQQTLTELAPQATFYRTGGEEFTVLLPETTMAEAKSIAAACQQRLQTLVLHTEDKQTFGLSSSMGVTVKTAGDTEVMDVFRRADHFLYHSKRNGRNQITTDDDAIAALD